jgi:hypothetical protein
MPAYRQTCQNLQLPIHKAEFFPLITMAETAPIYHCKKGFFTVMIWASGADHFR